MMRTPRRKVPLCRCCGGPVAASLEDERVLWCVDCRRHIVDGDRLAPEDRTFESQTGEVCPFADSGVPVREPLIGELVSGGRA
jgi:hypothetical protein